jgi:hypothetical protein
MRQAILFLILLILLPGSVVMQDLLPGIPPSQERILLLPVVFCFGVLALPLIPALFFSLVAALIQGLALIQIQSGQAEFGFTLPVVFFLSWAIVLQMTSEATHGVRWELHALGSGLVTLSLVAGQFLVLCIKRGGFPLDQVVFFRIGVPAAAAVLIAPPLYFALRSFVPMVSGDAEDLPKKPTFTR